MKSDISTIERAACSGKAPNLSEFAGDMKLVAGGSLPAHALCPLVIRLLAGGRKPHAGGSWHGSGNMRHWHGDIQITPFWKGRFCVREDYSTLAPIFIGMPTSQDKFAPLLRQSLPIGWKIEKGKRRVGFRT